MKNKVYKSAVLATTKQGNKVIKLVFPFDSGTLANVRTLTNRSWHKTAKVWTAMLCNENLLKLHKWGFMLSDELKAWYHAKKKMDEEAIKAAFVPGLDHILKPYQKEGIALIDHFNGKALLADDMGLGKTLQALCWLKIHPEVRPVVITCPSFLKINWEKEIIKWMGDWDVQIIYGYRKPDTIYTGDIIIVNYDILRNTREQKTNKKGHLLFDKKDKPIMIDIPYTGHVDYLKDLKPKALIMDEIHFLINEKAQRSMAVTRLSTNIPYRIGISGTPIEKKTFDIYNGIKIINKTIFPSAWVFKNRYCEPKSNGWAITYDGASNTKELHEILVNNVMIRRKKKNVLKELPDKTYSFVSLEMDNWEEYKEAELAFIAYVKRKASNDFDESKKNTEERMKEALNEFMESYGIEEISFGNKHSLNLDAEKKAFMKEKVKKANPLVQIGVLKQLAVKGKFKALLEWIENFLESGEKLVLFCEFVATVDEITSHFGKRAVKIHGGVSAVKRNKAVEAFQTDSKIRLFVGNKGAEVGLTLTAASNIGIVEYPWNPGPLAQRIDRVHRITQLKKVTVYQLTALNTIEKHIAEGLHRKQENIDKVMDGEITEETTLLEDLINHYKS